MLTTLFGADLELSAAHRVSIFRVNIGLRKSSSQGVPLSLFEADRDHVHEPVSRPAVNLRPVAVP